MNTTPLPGPRRGTVTSLLIGWLVLHFGARFLLEANPELSGNARLAIALIPMPAFAAFLVQFIRALRTADELERRIQLEALAVAFPLGLVMLTTLGLVQRAIDLPFEDWSYNHIWPQFILFYLFGLFLARRRYSLEMTCRPSVRSVRGRRQMWLSDWACRARPLMRSKPVSMTRRCRWRSRSRSSSARGSRTSSSVGERG